VLLDDITLAGLADSLNVPVFAANADAGGLIASLSWIIDQRSKPL
jgi:hypothetical protein